MDPVQFESKEQFFGKIDELVKESSLSQIDQIVSKNQNLISESKDRDTVRAKLNPLKVKITQSRNNPQDRLLVFKILSTLKESEPLTLSQEPHWKDAPFSQWEINQFRKALINNVEFNKNYELVPVEGRSNNFLGRGREGIVYLAKDRRDGKLMAIKMKCESQPEIHPYNGEEEVVAVKLFKNATNYEFNAENYSTFNAKSYIKGENLEHLLKSNVLFDGSSKSAEILDKLKELFTKLIEAKLFFADIAPENFVYDGSKFYMIDLRPFKVCEDITQTRNEYRNEILEKADGIAWSQDRWYHPDCAAKDKSQFIIFVQKILEGG